MVSYFVVWMEFMICESLACVAGWFNSAVGAAWAQAVLTVLAIFVSMGVSFASMRYAKRQHEARIQEDRDRAIHDQTMTYHRGMVRAKVVMSRLGGGADNILWHINNDLPRDPGLFRLALKEKLDTVRDDLADLRKIMLADLPNPGVIVLINNGVVIGEDFKAYLMHCMSKWPPLVDPGEAEILSKRMKRLHDHFHNYHANEFMDDPTATPKEFKDLDWDVP